MEKTFKPFDVIINSKSQLLLVLMGPLDIPYFEDHCGSDASFDPLDITNPSEWEQTFPAYICMDLLKQDYVVCSGFGFCVVDFQTTFGSTPFDAGTSRLRMILGLIKFADKLWENDQGTMFLKKHLKET